MSSSISSSYTMHRPDPSQMASKLFSKLDTKNQGYLEKSDLASAFANISGSSDSTGSTSSVDELFSQLDSNSDGKVTKDEMSSTMEKLAAQLDEQFNQMRMQGAQGSRPPPPPPDDQNDSGFSKDELTSQLNEIGSTDSQRSSLISSIVQNFDAADSDGNGKVTAKEAQAYEQKSQSSDNSSTSSKDSAASTEAKLMQQIMQLMQAYGDTSSSQSTFSSLLSASA